MEALPEGQEKPSLVIVGCGTVGTAMAKLLSRKGYRISAVANSKEETARKAAETTGAESYSDCPWEVTVAGDVVFITTPDDVIASVCSKIAEKKGFKRGAVVIHCSGALSSEILAPARALGAHVASLHPLQSFASADQALSLVEGSFFAVEGDDDAFSMVRQIVKDVGGVSLSIAPEKKTLYHAAAVTASNYLVTVMALAIALNESAGLEKGASFKALIPLVRGTLKNIGEKGIPDALTGPIARGDLATVAAHLGNMEKDTPEYIVLYRCLGLYTVELAKAKGTISPEVAEKMVELLRE
jgi:predicted short-subunit dehydrogenase-like oxidoreductase (DUF2520 family)